MHTILLLQECSSAKFAWYDGCCYVDITKQDLVNYAGYKIIRAFATLDIAEKWYADWIAGKLR